jgi:hypothetical protein
MSNFWGAIFQADRQGAWLSREGKRPIVIGYLANPNAVIAAYDQHLADCGVEYKRREWPRFPAEVDA